MGAFRDIKIDLYVTLLHTRRRKSQGMKALQKASQKFNNLNVTREETETRAPLKLES